MESKNDTANSELEEKLNVIIYKQDDINKLLQLLSNSKCDFDNIDLFYSLKSILLNPLHVEFDNNTTDVIDK